jgi:hypothetical protein
LIAYGRKAQEKLAWAPQGSLAEAKSLFAPYSPKFQTVPNNESSIHIHPTVAELIPTMLGELKPLV